MQMKAIAYALAFILIYAISASSLSARPVRIPKPEELADKAILICNGLVESIIEGNTEKGPGGSWDSITHFTAKIKILHVFKGQAPPEIEIKYHLGPNVPNGPIQVSLIKGERFRFYLKNGMSESSFVGVLEGKYDDGFAVEPLAPKEPDDGAPQRVFSP